MISQTVLIPELNCGFVVLTNNLSMTYSAVMATLLDYITEDKLDSYWSDYYLKVKAWVDDYNADEKAAWENSRIANTSPSFKPEDYCGTYTSDIYGDVEISMQDGNIYLKMTHTSIYQGKLEHWHYDTYSIKFEQAPSLPSGSVTFIADKYGKISEMKIDIPNPDFDFTQLKLYKTK
jgi:hypothetical protein